MGIDIYLRWNDMTDAEREAQHTGFSVEHVLCNARADNKEPA